MSDNPILAYGRWLADCPDAWPDEALESTHRQFIDVIAVTLAGAVEPVTRRVFETVKQWGSGTATAIGHPSALSAPWAALVNGTAAHALDFDDNFDPAKAHATAVLAPAILALAEQEDSPGHACLDAYIAGLQILGRVGQGVNPTHRNRGWHATATVGAIGAAAACARLLRLDSRQAAFAISIATSMAGGFMSQFGTMTKPLHAGLAAKSGILAASLARAGIDAGFETLDGPNGMNRLMVGPDYEQLRDTLTHVEHGQNLRFETDSIGEPLLILSSGFRVKRFPICGSAHRSMDAILDLKDRHGFTADQVDRVDVWAPVSHLNNLMYARPEDALQAKFSLEYGLAVCLVTGNFTLDDFSDGAVGREEVKAQYAKVHRHPVDKAEGEFPTRVEISLTDGRSFETEVAMPAGSLAAPFTLDQYWAKFEGCAQNLLSSRDVARLRQALTQMPLSPSIRPLMALMAGPFASNSPATR
ncbi:MAG: MmgE/PrpD family protein [Allosphingosinicella sp.]